MPGTAYLRVRGAVARGPALEDPAGSGVRVGVWAARGRTETGVVGETLVDGHAFCRLGWRWWLCRNCFAPRALHPRTGWARARPLGDRRFLSAGAPHFRDGW
ncbi:hypothetical protein ACWDTQ_31160 [Streptomyces cellulosae]